MIKIILINSVAVFACAYLLSGVSIKNYWQALLAAVVLAIANTIIKPVLDFIAFPITWLTLGLFSVVIDAIILMIVDYIMPGMKIKHFGWAILFAVILSIINSLLFAIF
ncbi:phage holin family protein [Rapidithrix thailandica]|uniref:Phage holin family protein n=1 Tax=Rapidithrix thailandica TaxID=413964 RepID=A0AAW9S3U3_9BACT